MSAGQRGGFAVGLVVGLLIGLAVALAVAVYVTKAPVPFVNKLPQRSAEQDAAEAERNKRWDPNAPLAGKAPLRPASAAGDAAAPPAQATAGPSASAAPAVSAARPTNPDAILSGRTTAPAAAPVNNALGRAVAINPAQGPALQFYVQAGAYATPDDADSQRAKLAMLGMAAKVMAREQAGRTVYRVRMGPYDDRRAAEDNQARLSAAGIEANLVRVER